MARLILDQFQGGERQADLPSEFNEGEWALLKNLVYEGGHRSLRTIWALQPVVQNTVGNADLGDGTVQVFVIAGETQDWIVIRHSTDGWLAAAPPGTTDADADVSSDLVSASGSPPAGQRGIAIVNAFGGTAVKTIPAIMLNGINGLDAGWLREDSAVMQFVAANERYPNSPEDGPLSLPKANVGIMWGDFNVLGDIEWLQDDTQPFSSGNAERYSNGLWFSQPAGKTGQWDILDVEFVGPRFQQIIGLAVIDAGLLVGTSHGLWVLRGTPLLHEIVRLSDVEVEHVISWPASGGGVWTQSDGQVWWTDGLTTRRLDRVVEPIIALATLGQHDAFIAAQGASLDTLGEHDTVMSGDTLLDHDRNPLHV